ncbi:MAG: T9SS type A sorting domain-containing protein [Saprospiraceae bacterium]|nr:MAG: T9SS type A sorting domain-containing protein [Saprospiraceae bacterium]
MKKKITSVYALFWALLSAFLFMSYASNPPNGYTGAPPTNNTCSSSAGGCHSGGTMSGNITLTGLPATITPNTTYSLTVTLTRTNSTPQRGGFQATILNASNSFVGSFSNAGPSSTLQMDGGITYFEHNPAMFFGGNDITYTVDWTSPASGSGTITMYTAGNFANGNGNNDGDYITTQTASGTFMGGGMITVNVSGTNVSCFGGNNGTATAMASGGGGGPYNYAWSNGGNTQTISNLPAGTYTVTVTNGAGGNGTGNVTLTQPPLLTAAIINQININCVNPVGSATAQGAGGVGGYTYAWSNGSSGQTAILPAGTHIVTVTDANACAATASVTILSDITPPITEAGPPMTITCSTPAVTLNGTGTSTGPDFVYQWTTVNGQIISGANTLHPLAGAAGTYKLTTTNTANGCTSSDNTTVTSNTVAPTADAGNAMQLTCTLTSVTLDGSGSSAGTNIIYLWTTANGHIVSGNTTTMAEVDAPGTYVLKVTNTANGCTASASAAVTSDTIPPVANAGPDMTLNCNNSSVVLDGSGSSGGGNISYLWTTANGNIVSGDSTSMAEADMPGTYVFTVTNTVNGCTESDSVGVTSDTIPPVANAGPGMALNCNNNSVVLDGSGSSQGMKYTYTWNGPGIVSGGNTPTPTVDSAGAYIIMVTDTINGCTSVDTTTVTLTPPLSAAIVDSTNVLCNGDSTGTATVEGTGGNGGFSYLWSNGDTTAQTGNLPAGIFSVTLTDEDDCASTASVTIAEPAVLSANASATGESSAGANDGTATASPGGGVPGYTFAWSTGDTTQTISNLPPGNYSIVLTDMNGCTISETVTVSSFDCSGFGVSLTSINPTCNGNADGEATATPSGGAMPFTYIWSSGSNSATATGLAAGTYTVAVTDSSNCEVVTNITLSEPPLLSVSITGKTNVDCHGNASGSATVSAAGGTPGYTFEWSNGGTGATQSNLTAGTYNLTATDSNGCTTSMQVAITEPPAFNGSISSTNETEVGATDGTASVIASGGTPGYAYTWNNGGTSSSITGLAPGEYCVTVADANGCTFNLCANVNAFNCSATSLALSSEGVSCFGGDDGSANAVATGFAEPVDYQWSNGDVSANIENLVAGIYNVSVSDANGCSATGQTEVTQPELLSLELLEQTDVKCEGQANGTATVTGIGGTPNYAYAWPGGGDGASQNNLSQGVYSVIVTDANACTASLSLTIGVEPDTVPPVAIAENLTVALDENGMVTLTSFMLGDGSFDNCALDSMALDAGAFNCDNLGENEVVLTVWDNAGNSASDTAIVTVVDEMPPVILCPANLEVTGCDGIVVEYGIPTTSDNCSPGNVFIISGLPSGVPFPEGATEITWGATDQSSNASACTFTITVISIFELSASTTEPSCAGASDGTAGVQLIGGVPPYQYAWDDPAQQTTQTATGLSAGTYSVSITDAIGCKTVATIFLDEPQPVLITVDTVTPEMGGNMDGAISVTVAGGTGPLSIEWFLNGSFYSSDEDLAALGAGTYVLQVTDANGCTATDSVAVENVTSTADPELESRISVFPNPVSGELHIAFDLGVSAEVRVGVYDLDGRLVLPMVQEKLQARNLTLDMTHQAPGIYILKMVVNEVVVVKRVVVSR